MRELWSDAALFFRTNDARSMNDALERFAKEPELRATYASLAFARAKERYTAQRMTDEYLNLYSVLTHSGAAAA
jgi:glycosyltransferase involved in cell wall biosynthesis